MQNELFDVLPRGVDSLPASAVIPFVKGPTIGDDIIIGGYTFVAGPSGDFSNADQFRAASTLATRINRNLAPAASGQTPAPVYPFYAFAVGSNLYVVARQLGSAGNAITLSGTAANGAFTIPSATLTGGSDAGSTGYKPTSGPALVVTANSAYAAGNVVGGLITFTGALGAKRSGLLQSLRLKIKSVQAGNFKLTLFRAAPATVFTDKTAPVLVAADVPLVLGTFLLQSPDSSLGGAYTVYVLNAIQEIVDATGQNLYGVLTCVGTPTFTTTGDVVDVTAGIQQD